MDHTDQIQIVSDQLRSYQTYFRAYANSPKSS